MSCGGGFGGCGSDLYYGPSSCGGGFNGCGGNYDNSPSGCGGGFGGCGVSSKFSSPNIMNTFNDIIRNGYY